MVARPPLRSVRRPKQMGRRALPSSAGQSTRPCAGSSLNRVVWALLIELSARFITCKYKGTHLVGREVMQNVIEYPKCRCNASSLLPRKTRELLKMFGKIFLPIPMRQCVVLSSSTADMAGERF